MIVATSSRTAIRRAASSVAAAGPSSLSRWVSSSSEGSTETKPLNRKQRFAHKVAQPNQDVLLRRPFASEATKEDRRPAAVGKFKLDDFASMSALLYHPDPILDSSYTLNNPPTQAYPIPSSVTMHNTNPETGGPVFPQTPPSASSLVLSAGGGAGNEIDSISYLSSVTPLTSSEIQALHRHTIVIKRVVRMTTKGKVSSMYALVVAGNGRGLVGYGEGKDTNAGKAAKKAFHEAVKRMDYVKRSEGRTIFTEWSSKWGASNVTLRPRPAGELRMCSSAEATTDGYGSAGFGLRVPPVIHSLARAAGISDLSASIKGSANPINVIKAACQILWGGSLPSGLGDGIGGSARRNDRGHGIPDLREIELARGRRFRPVRLGGNSSQTSSAS